MQTEELTLTPLTQELLEQTVALCDRCVGKNLYTRAELAQAMEGKERQFFLLVTPERKVAAYAYFRLIDIAEAERLTKQDLRQFEEKGFKEHSLLGLIQSIGVCEKYRHRGLSKKLVEIAFQWLLENTGAELAFGILWKPNGKAPMEAVIKKCGFSYLTDSQNVWYDNENLICPVCGGRCSCDAAIYYKVLERNAKQ